MAAIYVAGPVPSDNWEDVTSEKVRAHLETVKKIYSTIEMMAVLSGHRLQLPEPEPFLDQAKPQEFFGEIAGRIAEADAVITVLSPFDMSAAAESTIASMNGKNQLLVLHGLHSAPRIIEGMPSVHIVNGEDTAELAMALSTFFGPETRPPRRAVSR